MARQSAEPLPLQEGADTVVRGERFYWSSLRAAMDHAGMDRAALASKLGVGEHSVYHWLYGEFVPPLTKFRELVTVLSGDHPGGEAFRSLAADLMTDAPEQTRRQARALSSVS